MLRRRRVTRTTDELRRLADADWVLPHALDRAVRTGEPPVPRWTLVGNVGSPGKAAVDPRGLVTPAGATWSLDWWVGADDRWHLPSGEAAVRQHRAGAAPVVETAMRIPSGDAVQRVYGARVGTDDAVVVEVENASPIPFALALVVRPFAPSGLGHVGRVELDDRTVSVDGLPVLTLPRPPSLVAGADGSDGADVAGTVLSGAASLSRAWPVEHPGGMVSAAFVFPVTHRTRLRVALVPGRDGNLDVSRLPGDADVVASWDAMLRHGARAVLPDQRVQTALDAARSSITLFEDGVVVRPTPITGGARPADAVAVVEALEAWGLGRHADEARRSVPGRWRRRHSHRSATDPAAAVRDGLAGADDTFAWGEAGEGHHGGATARFLLAMRDLLVREADGTVAVLPGFPPEWEGHDVEVHDLPVAGGSISFAVRWHGERPALLWDLRAAARGVSAPALDPAWSATEMRGEALLRVSGDRSAGLPRSGA